MTTGVEGMEGMEGKCLGRTLDPVLAADIINKAFKLKGMKKYSMAVAGVDVPEPTGDNAANETPGGSNETRLVNSDEPIEPASPEEILQTASNLFRKNPSKVCFFSAEFLNQATKLFLLLMHWNLTFVDDSMEDEYLLKRSPFVSTVFAKVSVVIMAIVSIIIMIFSYAHNFQIADRIYFTILSFLFSFVFTSIVFSGLVLSSTSFYTNTLVCLSVLACIGRNIFAVDLGILGYITFSLLIFLLLRGRLLAIMFIQFCDLIFYNIYRLLSFSIISSDVLFFNLLAFSTIVISCYSAYYYELGSRSSHLLHRQCRREQEKSQLILNSIFPPHGISELYICYEYSNCQS